MTKSDLEAKGNRWPDCEKPGKGVQRKARQARRASLTYIRS